MQTSIRRNGVSSASTRYSQARTQQPLPTFPPSTYPKKKTKKKEGKKKKKKQHKEGKSLAFPPTLRMDGVQTLVLFVFKDTAAYRNGFTVEDGKAHNPRQEGKVRQVIVACCHPGFWVGLQGPAAV